jgi:hypothetical protein
MAGRKRQGRISGVTSTRRLPSRSGWQTAGRILTGMRSVTAERIEYLYIIPESMQRMLHYPYISAHQA